MSGFGVLFGQGCSLAEVGGNERRDGKKEALVLKVHDRSVFTRLHLESILPA